MRCSPLPYKCILLQGKAVGYIKLGTGVAHPCLQGAREVSQRAARVGVVEWACAKGR
jgi:hypothetical protein